MSLYTKTGDSGETGLIGGGRISKADLRVECYGTVDEINSALGFARSLGGQEYVRETIMHIQGTLFTLAAELAGASGAKNSHTIGEQDINYLEAVVDACAVQQHGFVTPGENPQSAALHLARTVVRRGERLIVRLASETADDGRPPIREILLRYINRLSDAVYALARFEETYEQQAALRIKVEAEVRRRLNLKPPFTLENIERMAVLAREKAARLGLAIVFAAVDSGGNPILLQRMENSLMGSIDVALNKAFTANAFKMPTHALGEAARPGGELYGIENGNDGRIVIFGGGFPYEYDGRIVGGVGVSGGTVEQDMLIARHALGD